MTGAKTSAHDFSSVHGSMSRGDDFDGIEDSSRQTSSTVTGQNNDSSGLLCGLTSNTRRADDARASKILFVMQLTISTKNWQNFKTSFFTLGQSSTTILTMEI